MPVGVTRTDDHTAQITWNPTADDPSGQIAHAIESGRLAAALAALGARTVEDLAGGDTSSDAFRAILTGASSLQADLERRIRTLVVVMRNQGATWAQLATLLYGDADKRSSARAAYNSGLRQLGINEGQADADDDQ
ncbi:hypothetical protein ABT160_43630 [Streptomyces sp. NPDC001941]|uniref:hypothetical protein n=1 Tax=Streptomyces sp. NPDC001941 TaxID=3154659 RepID=UPI00332252EF